MIQILYEPNNQRSAAYDEKCCIGECTYQINKQTWILNHTFVDSHYGGQGIAAKLVYTLIQQAREQKIKIIPQCSYVQEAFKKHPEWNDLL